MLPAAAEAGNALGSSWLGLGLGLGVGFGFGFGFGLGLGLDVARLARGKVGLSHALLPPLEDLGEHLDVLGVLGMLLGIFLGMHLGIFLGMLLGILGMLLSGGT